MTLRAQYSYPRTRAEAQLETREHSAPRQRGLVSWMDRKLYRAFQNNWDDLLFRTQINGILRQTDRLLDLGAGAGIVSQMNFRGRTAKVCGIDPDKRVLDNQFLDEAKVASGEDIPYQLAEFEVVIADNVLEHLEQPERVFREVARVLKPGGLFLAKTPNKYHYMPLIARLTPQRFHKTLNRWRGRDGVDIFPTRYRANSSRDIARLARESGLLVKEIKLIEGRPEYLRFAAPTYFLGWLYERAVNSIPGLSRFRILMIVVLEKPSAPYKGSA
jgi:SAM-dependent methyltransferase